MLVALPDGLHTCLRAFADQVMIELSKRSLGISLFWAGVASGLVVDLSFA
jgi:hypothetical protein